MKHATAKTKGNIDMLHKIESIEKEIRELKLFVLEKLSPSPNKGISLKGILKGIEISDEDITEAKKSLYCTSLLLP